MNAIAYLLIPVVLFVLLVYPLIRKAVSLLEIFVNRYLQNASIAATNAKSLSASTNLRLLAYERIVLFIERMKPDSLVPRTLSSTLSFKEYQLLLINEVRKEFEYNLSQQLYLSDKAWKMVVSFNDNVITLINSAAATCSPAATAGDLAKQVLEYYIAADLKVEQILSFVKADVKDMD